ncbi:hypothetical protein [Streptomyces beihaiensis]|uniref:Uncharacterized protein n=1 Tax=Streptomyces beihaiensis TaxID=2984495 RepID=A0ABT3U1I6_9ACTN|nr:hypothetical protein [Streptomyces beihaiensis]MCX3062472.1 hypothetical protein [Streptomyces beihaiensis]
MVQVGSGYPDVDAEHAFLWTRLADHTERQSLAEETERVTHGPESQSGPGSES